jgi:hypothetical protein
MSNVTLNTLRHNSDGNTSTGVITIDPDAASNPIRKVLAKTVPGLIFLKRLTPMLYSTILTYAADQLTKGNPQMSLWIDMLRVNGSINLSDPDTVAAKTALVTDNLLTQDQANALFS